MLYTGASTKDEGGKQCSIKEVSYSHSEDSVLIALFAICEGNVFSADIIPVSYTHLDVYKRQFNACRSCMTSCPDS